MKQLSKEEQMQKNGGKTLRISCQGVLNEKHKATGCEANYATQSKIKQVAEVQMGIHLTKWHHYLCTYVWLN